MLRTTVLVATAAAGLTATPAAHAAPVRVHCGYVAVAHAAVTGGADSFSGIAYGFAAFDDAGPHTVRCYVAVNGVEQASTLTGAGNALAGTAGPVAYVATRTDAVELCADADQPFPGHTTECEPVSLVPAPVQEVVDLLDATMAPIWSALDVIDPWPWVDPILCPVLASLAPGVPGVVDITPAGDTTLTGVGPLWDCPPYGDLGPPAGVPSTGLRVHARLP